MCTTNDVFRYAGLIREGLDNLLGPRGVTASTPKEVLRYVIITGRYLEFNNEFSARLTEQFGNAWNPYTDMTNPNNSPNWGYKKEEKEEILDILESGIKLYLDRQDRELYSEINRSPCNFMLNNPALPWQEVQNVEGTNDNIKDFIISKIFTFLNPYVNEPNFTPVSNLPNSNLPSSDVSAPENIERPAAGSFSLDSFAFTNNTNQESSQPSKEETEQYEKVIATTPSPFNFMQENRTSSNANNLNQQPQSQELIRDFSNFDFSDIFNSLPPPRLGVNSKTSEQNTTVPPLFHESQRVNIIVERDGNIVDDISARILEPPYVEAREDGRLEYFYRVLAMPQDGEEYITTVMESNLDPDFNTELQGEKKEGGMRLKKKRKRKTRKHKKSKKKRKRKSRKRKSKRNKRKSKKSKRKKRKTRK